MRKTVAAILTSIYIISTTSTALAAESQYLSLSGYKKGMEHDDIKVIQQALKRDGVFEHDQFTTYYGTLTEDAVIKFQRKYGLAADGIIGKSTIEKMNSLGLFTHGNLSLRVYKKGMTHSDIKIIQEALRDIGTYEGDTITTYFGSVTEKAVEDFQKMYGLTVDGVVGGSTIKKMENLGLVTHNIGVTGIIGNLTLPKYEKGMSHPEVKIIQKVLKQCGTFNEDAFTTYFGPVTEDAVKDFQSKYGLDVDGVVGTGTLQKMKSLGLINFIVSRGSVKRGAGEYLDWKNVKKLLVRNKTILTVKDLKTSLSFKVKVTAGSNHADVEPVSKNDTKVIKKVWGGFSWERRPVLVYLNNRTIAASMTAMPHAGVEGKPAGKYVSGRSGGYGYGYNYDFVKGNGISGHLDIHFKNSRRHKDNRKDSKHQACVKIAAGLQ
ncbi:peptidoglycan-binding domain-containing protein [Paramaledivibacter caminithermalis]|uniref:Peptidoglycan-binding (PGRP) domain of peptidoglycan hydrolases-containing protein n=1 Tax=Paramaledivibacter caminithermalis (strain DSM 15212 / CIP 107654 / DViRD3) TaxID=1121301 RepID=A0A1M6LF21_PARC5|nr:peptidoglycan-binding protein [Paramaledivibacter caminithermalis]SHJ69766.1 Peptidoglycan-binding (PGRP) domain of peptidoglycan hydrolases-containing protein [Paramaledivibacter caminithermalis DSM 15212]